LECGTSAELLEHVLKSECTIQHNDELQKALAIVNRPIPKQIIDDINCNTEVIKSQFAKYVESAPMWEFFRPTHREAIEAVHNYNGWDIF
jgi:hypothetical protein